MIPTDITSQYAIYSGKDSTSSVDWIDERNELTLMGCASSEAREIRQSGKDEPDSWSSRILSNSRDAAKHAALQEKTPERKNDFPIYGKSFFAVLLVFREKQKCNSFTQRKE